MTEKQEPSMEDILASIRNILAEDEEISEKFDIEEEAPLQEKQEPSSEKKEKILPTQGAEESPDEVSLAQKNVNFSDVSSAKASKSLSKNEQKAQVKNEPVVASESSSKSLTPRALEQESLSEEVINLTSEMIVSEDGVTPLQMRQAQAELQESEDEEEEEGEFVPEPVVVDDSAMEEISIEDISLALKEEDAKQELPLEISSEEEEEGEEGEDFVPEPVIVEPDAVIEETITDLMKEMSVEEVLDISEIKTPSMSAFENKIQESLSEKMNAKIQTTIGQAFKEETLISEPTAVAAAESFSQLRHFASETKLSLGRGDLTIETIVRETLKPYLKEWLDMNLPTIVERVVKKEVAHIMDRLDLK